MRWVGAERLRASGIYLADILDFSPGRAPEGLLTLL